MRIRFPLSPDTRRSLVDGFALAGVITTVYCAERFDAAVRIIEQLRAARQSDPLVEAAWPAGLTPAWIVVTVVFAVLGYHLARRVVQLAGRNRRRALPWLAFGAVAGWTLWQITGIAAIVGWVEERPRLVAHGLYWGTSLAAVAALVVGGRNVVGDFDPWRASLVRVHIAFLLLLFLIIFRIPITSAQMTDVLRAWGDGRLSRALTGIAGALMLGAVIRASARRLLAPSADEPAAGRGRLPTWMPGAPATALRVLGRPFSGAGGRVSQFADRVGRSLARPVRAAGRWVTGVFRGPRGWVITAALLGAALKLPAFGPVAFALAAVGLVALTTREVPLARVAKPERVGLHRFAGTLGTAPVAILLVGLVGAATDSLLLGMKLTESDGILLGCTLAVFVLFAVLAGTAHLPLFESDKELEPRWLTGVAALVLGGVTIWLPTPGAIGLLVLGLLLAFRALGRRGRPELWASWGAAAGLALATYVDPVDVPRAMGAFGVAMFGFAAIMAALHVPAQFALRRQLRWRPRGVALTAPVLLLLALWLLVATYRSPGDVHRARTVASAAGTPPTATIEDAVREFLAARPPVVGDPPYTPMVVVGASGGGTKAAYWTDLVLDCAIGAGTPPDEESDECGAPAATDAPPRRRRSLFLTSSVSGGSIGVHHLVANLHRAGGTKPWVKDTAGLDVLSPLISWGLFHDLPAFLTGAPTDPTRCSGLRCPVHADRAYVQEAAIHGGVSDTALGEGTRPVTIFNGTAGMLGWRRVLLSRLSLARSPGCPDGGPVLGAIDAHDLLAGEDVPLTTSALLSARFPVLLPPARLGASEGAVACEAPTHPDVHVRDGGLIENTGLMTIADLLPAILAEAEAHEGAPVRPIVVSVDDDVPRVTADDEYKRSLVGGLGLEDSNGNTRRSRATIRDLCEDGRLVYVEIRPQPHVGAQAATGWEISSTSRRRDLVKSLRGGKAQRELARLQALLDGSPGEWDECS